MPETQTSTQPKQNNYEQIVDDLFWLRKELEDFRAVIFDHTEIIAILCDRMRAWLDFPPPAVPPKE